MRFQTLTIPHGRGVGNGLIASVRLELIGNARFWHFGGERGCPSNQSPRCGQGLRLQMTAGSVVFRDDSDHYVSKLDLVVLVVLKAYISGLQLAVAAIKNFDAV